MEILARVVVSLLTAMVIATATISLPRIVVWLATQPHIPVFLWTFASVFAISMVIIETVRKEK